MFQTFQIIEQNSVANQGRYIAVKNNPDDNSSRVVTINYYFHING